MTFRVWIDAYWMGTPDGRANEPQDFHFQGLLVEVPKTNEELYDESLTTDGEQLRSHLFEDGPPDGTVDEMAIVDDGLTLETRDFRIESKTQRKTPWIYTYWIL